MSGELLSVMTDRQGKITTITIQTDAGKKGFAGCGARLSHLPHVAGALGRSSARISLFVGAQDLCVSHYVVAH